MKNKLNKPLVLSKQDIILGEIGTIIRFGTTGLLATLTHMFIVSYLIRNELFHPLIANFVAFFTSFIVSFFGHFYWTFKCQNDAKLAALRFFIVAITAFCINTLFLAALLKNTSFSPVFSAVISALIIPAISYFANRLWVFYPKTKNSIPILKPHQLLIILFIGLGLILYYPIINPKNINWIYFQGDVLQHYMGWAFFSMEQWSFPPGEIRNYAKAIGASLVLTDSIPIIAIMLKVIIGAKITQLQYIGAWSFIAFVLNGIIAYFFAKKVATDRFSPFVSAILIATLPPVVLRGVGGHGHEALTAIFLYILGFILFLTSNGFSYKKNIQWIFLLIAALGIHFYFFIFLGFLWATWLFISLISSPLANQLRIFFSGFGTLVTVLASAWLYGYFASVKGLSGSEFGVFSAEVFTYLNPQTDAWFQSNGSLPSQSLFLEGWKTKINGQYEGSAYAGLGVLIMFFLSSVALILAKQRYRLISSFSTIQNIRTLFLVTLFFFAVSWGGILTIGALPPVKLFEWSSLQPISGLTRSVGRYALPLLILLVVLSAAVIGRFFRFPFPIFAFILIIQALDLCPTFTFLINSMHSYENISDDIPEYKQVLNLTKDREFTSVVAYPSDDLTYFRPVQWLAAQKGLSTNLAYLARASSAKIMAEQTRLQPIFETGDFRPNEIYVSKIFWPSCNIPSVKCASVGDFWLILREFTE